MKIAKSLLSLFILSFLLLVACGDEDESTVVPEPPSPPVEMIDVLTKIPDPIFKKYIQDRLNEYDQNKDGKISEDEAASVLKLNLNSWLDMPKIKSLAGIEYFTGLRTLKCCWNELAELDLSKNTKLTTLDCSFNVISVLDLSNNTELTELYCSNASISKLNISKNKEIEMLICQDNALETLSFSKNAKISKLYCRNNQLKTLDLSNANMLDIVDCCNNRLTTLSLKGNKWLSQLQCNNNKLITLEVSGCKYLYRLDCSDNNLKNIDTKGIEDLLLFYCNNNQLETLDLVSNQILEELKAKDNSSLKNIYVYKGFNIVDMRLFEIPENTSIIEQNK